MPLFVKLRAGVQLDAALIDRIRAKLRSEYSPRHVPDKIYQVPGHPLHADGQADGGAGAAHLAGTPAAKAANRDAVANPAGAGLLCGVCPHADGLSAGGRRGQARLTLQDKIGGARWKDVKLLIGDRDVAAKGAATFNRLNPLSGEVATKAAAAQVEDAIAAADAAAKAFPAWSALGPNARRAKLNKAADLLEARAAQFATLMMAETGCTNGWGHFNVHFGALLLREAAAMTTQITITGEVVPSDVPGMMAMAIRQPVGVCLGIAPWNAPVILGVRSVAMPLACGNTVVLKASEVCPATHRLIGSVLKEAGLGEGVVNVITHDCQGCRGGVRGPDRSSGRAPREFHRFEPRRPHRGADRRKIFETSAPGARGQGAADRARGCRYRCRSERHGVRCLCQFRTDLHVHRARSGAREGGR